MDYPDEELEALQMSLKKFVSVAGLLYSSSEKDSFLRFVLAGRLHFGEQREVRVFVNARQETPPPESGKYQVQRDIDSVIGVSRDLPYNVAMAIFPLPSFRDTLTKNNHLVYQSSLCPAAKGVSLHKIPNMALGKVDRRHITRMCFPRMYQKGRSPAIPSDTRADIYNDCVRPSVGVVSPASLGRWPLDLDMAMLLYRDGKGQFHHGTIDLPSHLLPAFATELLKRFQQHEREEFHDAFFLHELRGTKSATHHDPTNEEARGTALNAALHYFCLEKLNSEDWVVDVALEVYQPNHILQWLVQGHRRILRFILPSATDLQLDAILQSKVQYVLDISAQVADLGGFRALPGSRGKHDQVNYINVYSTDKSATYQLHDGVFRRRKAWHLFPESIKHLVTDLERMANAFRSCGGDLPDKPVVEGNARMEARVPLSAARLLFMEVPHQLIQRTVVAYDCPTFWYFKYYRVTALYLIVKSLENVPPCIRLRVNSLMLGAIVIYQINAIIYRPGDGKAEPYLLESCCQHTPGSIEGQSVPIMYRRGLYFLSDLVKESGTYHIPDTRPVDSWVLEALYRRESMASIELEFSPTMVKSLSKKRQITGGGLSSSRALNKRKVLSGLHPPDIADEEQGLRRLWKGEIRVLSSTDSPDECNDGHEEGESLENETRVERNELELGPGNGVMEEHAPNEGTGPNTQCVKAQPIQQALGTIKRIFATDVLSCAPNPRRPTAAWMLLSKAQRDSATLSVFMSPDFGQILRQVQCRDLSEEEWRTLAFERYFPRKAEEGSPRQNFTKAEYHKAWISLIHTLDEETISKATEEVYAWFKNLYWIPLPDSDRMWNTRHSRKDSFWTMVPESSVRHLCPRIAINSARRETSGAVPGNSLRRGTHVG